jgi:hypothetical protein
VDPSRLEDVELELVGLLVSFEIAWTVAARAAAILSSVRE